MFNSIFPCFATYNKERIQTVLLLEQQMDTQRRKIFFSNVTTPLFEMLGFLGLCGILVLSVMLISGENWLVVLAPFIIILSRCIPQVSIINNLRNLSSLNGADYDAVKAFIQVTRPVTTSTQSEMEPFHHLEFKDVAFEYGERKGSVLMNFNLTINRGEWVLITGLSGSGKSTVLSLIAGLYEPTAGHIFVNGIDLKQIDLQSWRRHIGFVEQAPFIFNGPIRDNVAYREGSVAEDKIWTALEVAGLDEFVRQLHNGLDTQMGDGGVQFSGGQRQRLAVARALCHDPDVLVLDEPTSALDRTTEMRVLRSLRVRYPEKTIIAVSHSEEMQESFGRVYRLEHGRIVTNMTSQAITSA